MFHTLMFHTLLGFLACNNGTVIKLSMHYTHSPGSVYIRLTIVKATVFHSFTAKNGQGVPQKKHITVFLRP